MEESSRRATSQAYVLSVFRVAKDKSFAVRMLSDFYAGYMTHYVKKDKRSHFCLGANCPGERHKNDLQWKGYSPVEIWCDARKLWFPHVLEITESLELDFRGRVNRGQLWELFRDKATQFKQPPVMGRFVRHLDDPFLRSAFSTDDPVKILYHAAELPPSVPSPIPPRIYVEPSAGKDPQLPLASPFDLGPKEVLTPEQQAEQDRKWKEAMDRMRSPRNPTPANGTSKH